MQVSFPFFSNFMCNRLKNLSHLVDSSILALIHFVDGPMHLNLLSCHCVVQVVYGLLLINFQPSQSRFHVCRLNASSEPRVLLLFIKVSKRISRVRAEFRLERPLYDLSEISGQVPSVKHISF